MQQKPSLKKHYQEVVVPELQKRLGYKNKHQIPAIQKIVINSGVNASRDKTWVKDLVDDIANITGQQPVTTKASVSISNFKLRQGMVNGVKVTLRGDQMYNFLLRLISITLPSVRDFRGVPSKMDGRGNYTLGINDHTVFPEIAAETTTKDTIGMDITIVTSAEDDNAGRELLTLMGMPFYRRSSSAEAQASAA